MSPMMQNPNPDNSLVTTMKRSLTAEETAEFDSLPPGDREWRGDFSLNSGSVEEWKRRKFVPYINQYKLFKDF